MNPDAIESEGLRLRALLRYDILDTAADKYLDRLVDIAKSIFDAPIGLISLVDEKRQWFKSKSGLDVEETSREVAFCDHAIRRHDVMIVPNALEDDRFKDNPLVLGPPHIRFYIGAPIQTPDGFNIGTLCIIDTVPRGPPSDKQVSLLRALSEQVMHEIDIRKKLGEARAAAKLKEIRESILATVTDAPNFPTAINRGMDLIKEALGAMLCLFWRLAPDGFHLLFVGGGRVDPDLGDAYLQTLKSLKLNSTNSLVGQAIKSEKQIISVNPTVDEQKQLPAVGLGFKSGIASLILTPIRLLKNPLVLWAME